MLKNPVVSEKSMNLSKGGFYTFLVDKYMNKDMVKKQAEERFKVDVLEVRIINIHGKTKMQRTRKGYFQTKGIKKAIIKVKKGQKIPLFENLGEESFGKTQDGEVSVRTVEGEEVAKVKEKKSLLGRTKVRIESSNKSQESSEKIGKQTKKGSKEK